MLPLDTSTPPKSNLFLCLWLSINKSVWVSWFEMSLLLKSFLLYVCTVCLCDSRYDWVLLTLLPLAGWFCRWGVLGYPLHPRNLHWRTLHHCQPDSRPAVWAWTHTVTQGKYLLDRTKAVIRIWGGTRQPPGMECHKANPWNATKLRENSTIWTPEYSWKERHLRQQLNPFPRDSKCHL